MTFAIRATALPLQRFVDQAVQTAQGLSNKETPP